MNDDLDVLTRLVAYHDHITVPETTAADDVRRGQQRVRRTRTLVTGGVALGVATILTTTALVVTAGDRDSAPPPIAPTPTETVTDPTPVDGPRNGRIVRAEEHLPPGTPTCPGCSDVGFLKSYDPVTDRALWSFYDLADVADGATQLGAVSLVGPEGELAALACPGDFACRPEEDLWTSGMTLGPGPEQLTIETADDRVAVIGLDGTVRRTLDLSAGLDRDEQVDALAWSPDRSRLAVLVSVGGEKRIRLFDRDGGRSVLAYTSDSVTDLLPESEYSIAYVSDLAWAPGGSRLAVVAEYTRFEDTGEETVLRQAVAIDVAEAGEEPAGRPTTLYTYETIQEITRLEEQIAGGSFLWSPDGTRAAVLDDDVILELSAADGEVLARHPADRLRRKSDVGWLIWPARKQ